MINKHVTLVSLLLTLLNVENKRILQFFVLSKKDLVYKLCSNVGTFVLFSFLYYMISRKYVKVIEILILFSKKT